MIRSATLFLIRLYQNWSATREATCKFYPSCSNYAATAINRYGFKGALMAARRLARCHPWTLGGIDYVDADLDSSEARDRALNNGLTAHISTTNNSVISSLKEGVH
jgi:putative membrane protein insertion efficiency factor